MKKIFLALSIAVLALSGCTKDIRPAKAGKRLADIYVLATAGEKAVFVENSGLWRAASLDEWISTDVNGRNGNGAITLKYDSNESDATQLNKTRFGRVIITDIKSEVADTIVLIQQGIPDGKTYESKLYSDNIEFTTVLAQNSCKVAYVNLRGVTDPMAIASWASSQDFDVAAVVVEPSMAPVLALLGGNENLVYSGNLAIVAKEQMPLLTSTQAGLHAIVSFGGLSVADFEDVAESDRPAAFKQYLLGGYNAQGAPSRYIASGAFFHYSTMECGYADTPAWYPASLRDVAFTSDLYAWKNNLMDCWWMVSPKFNAVYSDAEGRSWRPDYVYASTQAFNTITSVEAMDIPLAGAKHKAIVVTMKY